MSFHIVTAPRAFGLRLLDDSMVDLTGPRSYPIGAIIIVDPDREAKPGDRVAVRMPGALEDKMLFKQLDGVGGELWLRSLNPQSPAAELLGDAKIVGVVVQTQIDE